MESEARRLGGLLRIRIARILCLLAAVAALPGAASAAPPKLIQTPQDARPPSEVQPGHTYPLSIHYQQDNGDYPSRLVLVVDPPSGPEEVLPPNNPPGDPRAGFTAEFAWTPQQSGAYRLHFEAASKVEPNLVTRFPDAGDLQIGSTSLAQKYITFALLLILTLVLLPYLVFAAMHAVNKNADPSATARTALLVGVLASYALYVYLFYTFSGPLMVVLVGMAAVAVLAVLLTRRR